LNLFEEVANIAEDEFNKWSHKELVNCSLRLLTLELFIRIQESQGKTSHVWLTSSNHPLLLKVFEETEAIPMSKDLMDNLTRHFLNILEVDINEFNTVIGSIVSPLDLEEEEQ
jgi:hypothetical protein|tara:strand:+ start:439 stop:777 length:339 start_codon:yes stop_codon:yes gene_type:complete